MRWWYRACQFIHTLRNLAHSGQSFNVAYNTGHGKAIPRRKAEPGGHPVTHTQLVAHPAPIL